MLINQLLALALIVSLISIPLALILFHKLIIKRNKCYQSKEKALCFHPKLIDTHHFIHLLTSTILFFLFLIFLLLLNLIHYCND
jgi:hypothetical protein